MALYVPHSIFQLARFFMSGRKLLDPTTYIQFKFHIKRCVLSLKARGKGGAAPLPFVLQIMYK